MDKENVTVVLGQDFSFDSAVVREDTLKLNQVNLNISTNASNHLNTSLWEHNFDDPADKETVFKISASPEQAVEVAFKLTSLPTPDGEYVLKHKDNRLQSFSAGTVSWSWTDWENPENFSLVFDKKEESNTESSGSSSSSSSISLSSSVNGDHCWSNTGKNNFEASNVGDIYNLTLTAATNSTKFCITTDKVDQPEDTKLLDNVYSYYQIELEGMDKTEISGYNLVIDVNQSFVDRYNAIKFNGYNQEWKELDAKKVSETSSSSRYRLKADKLDYLAVNGENIGPVCGDGLCNGDEDWQSCSLDCEKPEEVVEAEKTLRNASEIVSPDHSNYDTLQEAIEAFEQKDYERAKQLAQEATVQEKKERNYMDNEFVTVAALVLVFMIVIASGYVYWRRKLKIDAEKLSEQVLAEIESREISDRGQAYREIMQAQEALKNGDYHKVKKRLENTEKIIDDD